MSMAEAARSRETEPDIAAQMAALGADARAAAQALAATSAETRRRALRAAAASAIRDDEAAILEANAADMAAAQETGVSAALLDRLALDPGRVEGMAAGVEQVAALDDPLGRLLGEWERPNGLRIHRVSVPIGVIGIIYESRPNVTADAGALCLMSGNAAILRGGSESYHSSRAIAAALRAALVETELPAGCIQLVPTTDRAAVGILLGMDDALDLIVPRGGRSLIERVLAESRVPVMAHLDGNCHVYVHAAADPDKARDVTFNAKMRRTGICGAAETLLVDAAMADALPSILEPLFEAGCEVRGDERTRALDSRVVPVDGQPTGGPNTSTRSSRSGWWMGSMRRSPMSTSTAPTIPMPSSRRTRLLPSASWRRSTAGSCSTTPRPSSPTAGSSAWAPRSASPPASCTRAGRWASSSSPRTSTKCTATGRFAPDHARPHAPPARAAGPERCTARAAAGSQDRPAWRLLQSGARGAPSHQPAGAQAARPA